MRPRISILILLSSLFFSMAAAPGQTQPPPASPTITPTPTFGEACQEGLTSVRCVLYTWNEIGGWTIVIVLGFGGAILFWGFLKSAGQEGGKLAPEWLSARLHRAPDPTRQYLQWFVTQYQDPKFGALSLGHYEEKRPATLKEIYLPVPVAFDLTPEESTLASKESQQKGKQREVLASEMRAEKEFIGLEDALKRSQVLAIEGIPGSGKSTLLQWVGLNCALALLKQEIRGQKKLLDAMGGPLFPIFIPLGAFDRFCKKQERQRSAAAILDFATDWYRKRCETQQSKSAIPPLPDEFFATKLKNGCLLLFDGVDEVAPNQRLAVRRAVQEVLSIHAHPRTHALITARPTAAAEAQTDQARHGRVLALDEGQRNQLIRNLYRYYDPADAGRRSTDLIQRLDASDERVRRLAETPLLTTIFTVIHRPGHELPNQRAEVYDSAVETLLRDLHRKDAHEMGLIGDSDSAVLRGRMALIAFQLHRAGVGEEGKPENDLIDLLMDGFSTAATDPQARRAEIRNFLYAISMRGGLLEEQDCAFGFRTHRSFQEFLAGCHLVINYAPFDLKMQAAFITKHLSDDHWVEPIRLAAGFLAVRGENQAKAFVQMLAELGQTQAERDYAIALAGLSLADLPAQPAYRDLRQSLPGKMLLVIERDPPSLPLRLRFDLGLGLGSLKDPADPKHLFDPRLRPGQMPVLSKPIPAGPFRMGSNANDEEKLKAQGVKDDYIWDDEKTGEGDLIVEISHDYQIGLYPVTNAEYGAFVDAQGYGTLDGEQPPWWSETGWRWRTGRWDTQDFSMYSEAFQKMVKKWLASRPAEKRDGPFWQDDPKWNAANLPVVGVCWFEAEAYCNWLTGFLRQRGELRINQVLRLPTEAEWEKAARGVGSEGLWPWGDHWDASACNTSDPDLEEKLGCSSPVGIYPHGASPCGALDMVGNVWEWCLDGYSADQYRNLLAQSQSVVDPRGPENEAARVLRGGSWLNDRCYARCASRGWGVPDLFLDDAGFRVVCAPHCSESLVSES